MTNVFCKYSLLEKSSLGFCLSIVSCQDFFFFANYSATVGRKKQLGSWVYSEIKHWNCSRHLLFSSLFQRFKIIFISLRDRIIKKNLLIMWSSIWKITGLLPFWGHCKNKEEKILILLILLTVSLSFFLTLSTILPIFFLPFRAIFSEIIVIEILSGFVVKMYKNSFVFFSKDWREGSPSTVLAWIWWEEETAIQLQKNSIFSLITDKSIFGFHNSHIAS